MSICSNSRRPQGVPYAGSPEWAKEHNGVALPSTYRAYAVPLNIVGAIELEASPWIEDNLWVLEQEHTDPLFVGTVGDLEPEKPDFADQLARFRKDPLFLGIRCGNIWNREVAKQVNDPKFIDGLKRVADADLVMDSANPTVGAAADHGEDQRQGAVPAHHDRSSALSSIPSRRKRRAIRRC